MWVLEELDGDGYVGVVLQALPHRVVIVGEGWPVLLVVVLLQHLLMLRLHQYNDITFIG